jgi:hypothetical protein
MWIVCTLAILFKMVSKSLILFSTLLISFCSASNSKANIAWIPSLETFTCHFTFHFVWKSALLVLCRIKIVSTFSQKVSVFPETSVPFISHCQPASFLSFQIKPCTLQYFVFIDTGWLFIINYCILLMAYPHTKEDNQHVSMEDLSAGLHALLSLLSLCWLSDRWGLHFSHFSMVPWNMWMEISLLLFQAALHCNCETILPQYPKWSHTFTDICDVFQRWVTKCL